MDVAKPYTAVCPTLDGEVLSALAGTTRRLTGREVARLVRRGSQAGVNRTLRRLVEHGLVLHEEAGAAILYVLNREHLAAPAVEILAGMRAELVRKLRSAMESWKVPPAHASLFGSAARGDGDTSSDIDILLVRNPTVAEDDRRWREQVDQLVRQTCRWTGNQVGLSEVSRREVGELRERQPAVVSELHTDAITLYGPAVSKILGRARGSRTEV